MKKVDFKKLNIIKSVIDNGYRVAKTYQYQKINNNNLIVTIDRDSLYGIKCYVISINNIIFKINDKILYYDTLQEAEQDVLNIFNRIQPKNYKTYVL